LKKYTLFLGCVIPLRIASVELAARKTFQKLGVELVDLEGYSCCPDPVVSRVMDRKMWLTLAARNLSLAEEAGLDVVPLCNGCYETLAEAEVILQREPETRKEIEEILQRFGRSYEGRVKVRHYVEVLYEDIGVSRVKHAVEKTLKLRAALHYGCHLFRPGKEKDIWRKPKIMDDLVRTTGTEVVNYNLERLCCGFPTMHADEEFSLKNLLLPKLREINRTEAECIVTTCPACTIQFETGQILLRKYGVNYDIPCIYLTELLALAFGVPSNQLSLAFHRSPVQQLAQKLEGS